MWVKDMPKEAGLYFVATSYGEPAGTLDVCPGPTLDTLFTPRHIRRVEGRILPGTAWGGLWWDMPIMSPPSPLECVRELLSDDALETLKNRIMEFNPPDNSRGRRSP